ncbi:hypothetical protein ABTE71_19570, partial [Acinetobacter baumannii]
SMPPQAATGAERETLKTILHADQPAPAGPSKAGNLLNDEQLSIARPPLESLIRFNDYLNPFTLDATSTSAMTLRDALVTGIDQNLDLAIS